MNAASVRPRPATPNVTAAPSLALPARFLLLGALCFVGLALAAPWTLPLLLTNFYDPWLLAFVHANTLGAIGSVAIGAGYQLTPVVLGTPIEGERWALASFPIWLGGVVLLPLGLATGWAWALGAGGTLLALAVAIWAATLWLTFRRSTRRDAIAWHLAVAPLGACGGAIYGIILALNKGLGFLGEKTLANLGAHAAIMLGGWIAVLIGGAALELAGMFSVARDAVRPRLAWAQLWLLAGGAWLLSTSLHLRLGRGIDLLGASLLLAGVVALAVQLVAIHRGRRRKVIDIHAPFALLSAASGVAAAALVVWGLATNLAPGSPLWLVAGWLAIAGFAETAILGFGVKIASFLAWLQGHGAGKRPPGKPLPKLDELYDRRLALVAFALWAVAIPLVALATAFAWQAVMAVAVLPYAAGLLCWGWVVAGIVRHARGFPA